MKSSIFIVIFSLIVATTILGYVEVMESTNESQNDVVLNFAKMRRFDPATQGGKAVETKVRWPILWNQATKQFESGGFEILEVLK